jgi:deazaflavin-dependent oxidoreductase (nitroreductase family)
VSERDDRNHGIIEEFRANAGVVGGFFAGKPILLLHHKGAKSVTERVNPLMYNTENGRLVIFASMGGAPKSPDWYHNLVANPQAEIEVGTERYAVVATVLTGEDRERIWKRHKVEYPQFADYEAKTERVIPVIALARV